MNFASYVPASYFEARQRFRSAVGRHATTSHAHPLPGSDDLTLDVARVGPASSDHLAIVSSGLHGAEGPLGSAVQLAVLDHVLPAGAAVLFLHALNPFGYHYSRRADADNVDLNRNFRRPGEAYVGAPPLFDRIDSWLNPARGPGLDLFAARLWLNRWRFGLGPLRQAIAGGQYVNPRGLFFGGFGPSPVHRLLDDRLPEWVGTARRIIHLDFHTGLGAYGTYKLLIASPAGSPRFDRWVRRFGADVVEGTGGATAYVTPGAIDEWVENKFADRECDSACAEFGTYPMMRVLRATRNENLAWHHARHDHKAAAEFMRETFVPADAKWRSRCVSAGLELVKSAVNALIEGR